MELATERWVEDWYTLELDEEELRYPALPVELAHEHFDRHREEISHRNTIGDGDQVYHRVLEAQSRVEARDADLTYMVANRMETQTDVLRIDAVFPAEHLPGDPHGYVGTIRENRMETLLDDVEAVYEAAKTAAYMVPEVRSRLVANNNAPEDITLDAVVERSREKAQGYYGDMPGDTLITPLAWYLEDGRDGRVAPFSYVFSGDKTKRAKEEKGSALIDTYYDVMKDCVDVLHDV